MKKIITESEFNQLVYDHQHLIWKVCRSFYHTRADQEDLFQEIVIKMWQGIRDFREESKLSTWLYRVALNTAISQRRKSKKILLFQPEDYPPPTDDQSVYVEQTQALYAGIRRLKKVERAIILLYLEEQTYEEIAEITGLTKTNVSVKLVRIKAKLEKTVKSLMKSNQL